MVTKKQSILETEILFGSYFVFKGFKISESVFLINEKIPRHANFKPGDKVRLMTVTCSRYLGEHPMNPDNMICCVRAELPVNLNFLYGIPKEYVELFTNPQA